MIRKFIFVFAAVYICYGLPVAADDSNNPKEKPASEEVLSADGPYVLYRPDGKVRIISVDDEGKVADMVYDTIPEHFSLPVTACEGKYSFEVKLHPVKHPEWQYPQPEKTFVMSDPHGRLDCVIDLLQGNGVIDKNYDWSFGKNHLMIIGDVFDRGDDMTQICWLFYKLEAEAEQAGGCVSFLLGNHEPMVLANDLRYTTQKYKALARQLDMEYPRLWGSDTELGKWLGTRNTMQIIGNDLYVHAGIGKRFYDLNLTIPAVNDTIRKAFFMTNKERRALSPLTSFLYRGEGPLWYRGLVRSDEKSHPLSNDTLQMVLDRYKVKHIIVGHTIFEDISVFYDGKVIAVNVDNKKNQDEKRGRALLIEGENYFVVGDEGILRKLGETPKNE